MDLLALNDDRPHARFSLRSLLGVHGAAAAACEFASSAPLVAGLIGVLAAFVLLQIGVLAACTWHVPRIESA
jgi:hypothetical protein